MPNPSPIYVRLDDNGLLYLLTLLKNEINNSGEENTIEIIKRNGVTLEINPVDKSVNVLVPTDSDIESLITAHGYQTASDVTSAIDAAIAGITGIEFEIVSLKFVSLLGSIISSFLFISFSLVVILFILSLI